MTAESTFLPRKSDAESFSFLRWRVVISETETMDGSSASLSCIEKAMVPLCSMGWAELWQGEGSIDLNLIVVSQRLFTILPQRGLHLSLQNGQRFIVKSASGPMAQDYWQFKTENGQKFINIDLDHNTINQM